MDNKNTVVERLELQLGYQEFISSLRTVTNSYHSALDQMSNMGANVGKTITQTSKLVHDTVRNLSIDTANAVKNAFSGVEANLGSIHSSIKRVSSQITSDLDNLERLTAQKGKAIRDKNKELANIDKYAKKNKLSDETKEGLKTTAIDNATKKIAALDVAITGMQSKMYGTLSKLGSQATSGFSKSIAFTSDAIKGIATESTSTLKTLFQNTGNYIKDINNVVSGQKTIDIIKKQREDLGKQLIGIDQERVRAKQATDIALLALNKQTNAKLYKEAFNNHKKAEEEYTGILNKQKGAIDAHKRLGTALNETYARLPQSIAGIKEVVTANTDEINKRANVAINKYKQTFGEMGRSVAAFGTLGREDIGGHFAQFSKFNLFIEKGIAKLNEYIAQLSKVKSVDPGLKEKIDQLTAYRDKLASTQKQMNDAAKVSEKLNFTGPLVKSQEKLDAVSTSASRLFAKIESQKKIFKGEDFSSALGISQGLQSWKQIKSYSEQMRTQLRNIRIEISNTERIQAKYEVEMVRTSNEQKKAAYRNYVDAIKSYINELQAKLAVYEQKFTTGRALRETLVLNSEKFKESIQAQMVGWKGVTGTIDSMKSKFEEVRMYSSRYGKSNIENAQNAQAALRKQADEFVNTKQKILETIRSLSSLTKSKDLNFNATGMINELAAMLRMMNTAMQQIRLMTGGATKFVDQQVRNSSKSWYTLGWEYVRNFRWQVASAIYLTSMFVRGIQTYFVGALEKVDEFRKSVYAVTASIGLTFGKDFGKYYEQLYTYSSTIAEKLQAKAGQTYASLQDMMMVTKSLAQGGIFPKTDEDIDRISTLSTAVKVMTEGMANAGVQMRQEIMALIEGRQRVTDSVAIAFKMQGIDIKREMDKWAREGKSKLQGFAELLEPFARINKEINKELGVQINHLKSVWEYVQRIALTKLTLGVAQDIKNFAESIRAPSGALTDFGKNLTAAVSIGFNVVYELAKGLTQIVSDIFNMFIASWEGMLPGINAFFELLGMSTNEMSKQAQLLRAMVLGIESAVFAARLLISPFVLLAEIVRDIFKTVGGIVKGLADGDWTMLKEAWADKRGAVGRVWDDYNAGIKRANDLAISLDAGMKKLNETNKDNVIQILNYGEAKAQILKFSTELEEIEGKNLNREDKAEKQIKGLTEKYTAIKTSVVKQIKDINDLVNEATKGPVDSYAIMGRALIEQVNTTQLEISDRYYKTTEFVITTADLSAKAFRDMDSNNVTFMSSLSKGLAQAINGDVIAAMTTWGQYINYMLGISTTAQNAILRKPIPFPTQPSGLAAGPTVANLALENLKNQKEQLSESLNVLDAQFGRTVDAIRDKANAGGKTLLDMWEQYIGLLEQFGSIDPFEKLTFQYWKHLADIEKAAQDNVYVMQNMAKLKFDAEKFYMDSVKKKQDDLNSTYTNFYRRITSKEASPIQKITEDYKNLIAEIEASDLSKANKAFLQSMIPAQEELAKFNQRLKDTIELEKKRLGVTESYTKYLDLSTSSVNKRISSELKLKGEYQKWFLEQKEVLRKAEELAVTDPTEYGQAFKDQQAIFEQSSMWQKAALDEQLKEVWEPYYKDLKDMQEGWKDSISSTFTDILFDATDWKTKISDLFKDISKQIINAFIKRNIVEPMFDQTSDLAGGGILGSLFGSSKEGESSTGPMSYVNKIMNSFGLGTKPTAAKNVLGYTIANPLPVQIVGGSIGSSLTGTEISSGTGEESTGIWNTIKDWGSSFANAFGFASGGHIPGYGGGDKVPLLAESGEYVIRKEVVKKLGKNFFDNINGGSLLRRATGGPVDNYTQLLSGLGTSGSLEGGAPGWVNNLSNVFSKVAVDLKDVFVNHWENPSKALVGDLKYIYHNATGYDYDTGKVDEQLLSMSTGGKSTKNIYRGTDLKSIEELLPYAGYSKKVALDSSIGTHWAEDIVVAKNFAKDFGARKSGNMFSGEIDPSKFKEIPFKESVDDTDAMIVDVLKTVFSKDNNVFDEWVKERLNLEEFIGSKTYYGTDIPVGASYKELQKKPVTINYGSTTYHNIDDVIDHFGSEIYSLPEKFQENLVKEYRNILKEQGYEGISYTNTSRVETLGATSPKAYVTLDNRSVENLDFEKVFGVGALGLGGSSLYSTDKETLDAGAPDWVNNFSKIFEDSIVKVSGLLKDTLVNHWEDPSKALVDDLKYVYHNATGYDYDTGKVDEQLLSMFTGPKSKVFSKSAQFSSLETKQVMAEIGDELSNFRGSFRGAFDSFTRSGEKSLDGKLVDILKHDKLYEAYPELREMPVSILEKFNAKGSYSYPDSKYGITEGIKLASADFDQMQSTLLHEIQHAINFREGFPQGGNLATKDILRTMRDKFEISIPTNKDFGNLGKYINETGVTLEKGIEDFTESMGRAPDKFAVSQIKLETDLWDRGLKYFGTQAAKDYTPENLEKLFKYAETPKVRPELVNIAEETAQKSQYGLELLEPLKKDALSLYGNKIRIAKNDMEVYTSVFGEFMSRDTQARRWLTPENRLSNMPLYDKNMPLGDSLLLGQPGGSHSWLDTNTLNIGSKWKESAGLAGGAAGFGMWDMSSSYLEKREELITPLKGTLEKIYGENSIVASLEKTKNNFDNLNISTDSLSDGFLSSINNLTKFSDILDISGGSSSSSSSYDFSSITDMFTGLEFASGGHIPGYGGGDTIPAMLEAGEYVINKDAVKTYGTGFLNKINTMGIIKRASGGLAAMAPLLGFLPMGMNIISSLFDGGSKGKGKGAGTGSVIPVYVTNISELNQGIASSGRTTSRGVGGGNDIFDIPSSSLDASMGGFGSKRGFLSGYLDEFKGGGGGGNLNVTTSAINDSFSGLSNSVTMATGTFGQLNTSGDSLASSFMNNAGSLTSSISSMISGMSSGGGMGGGGGGGIMSLFSGLFGGGGSEGMAEGGTIKEPIFGVGLKSGTSYSLGEKGEELVIPKKKLKPSNEQSMEPSQSNVYVNFHLNAIDSKTGAEFLMKNSDVLESVVSKAVKGNRGLRRDVKNSY